MCGGGANALDYGFNVSGVTSNMQLIVCSSLFMLHASCLVLTAYCVNFSVQYDTNYLCSIV